MLWLRCLSRCENTPKKDVMWGGVAPQDGQIPRRQLAPSRLMSPGVEVGEPVGVVGEESGNKEADGCTGAGTESVWLASLGDLRWLVLLALRGRHTMCRASRIGRPRRVRWSGCRCGRSPLLGMTVECVDRRKKSRRRYFSVSGGVSHALLGWGSGLATRGG